MDRAKPDRQRVVPGQPETGQQVRPAVYLQGFREDRRALQSRLRRSVCRGPRESTGRRRSAGRGEPPGNARRCQGSGGPASDLQTGLAAYNAAQINEKAKFLCSCTSFARVSRSLRSRPRRRADGPPSRWPTGRFPPVLKVYTTLSGRRASTDMRDAASPQGPSHARPTLQPGFPGSWKTRP